MIIRPSILAFLFTSILLQKKVSGSALLAKGMSALKGMAGGGAAKPSQNGKCRQVVIVGEPGPDDSVIANKLKEPMPLPKIKLPKFGKKKHKKRKKGKHNRKRKTNNVNNDDNDDSDDNSTATDIQETEDYKDFREYKRTHNGNRWMNSSPKYGNPNYFQSLYEGRYPYSHSMYAYAAPPQPIGVPPPPQYSYQQQQQPPPQYQYQYQQPPPPRYQYQQPSYY